MTKNQLEIFDKAKDIEEEISEDGSAKQQSKGFLPAYLKKVEDKVDTLENIKEELVKVNLDPNDLEKKVLVGTLQSKKEREELVEFLKKNYVTPQEKVEN